MPTTSTTTPPEMRPTKRPRPSEQCDTNSPAEITDSDQWIVGDVELISSDNVRFRAPAYLLQSNSTVLQRLISARNNNVKCLRFTDRTIEDSTVLGDFLDLLINARTPFLDWQDDGVLMYNDPSFGRCTSLLRFLIKYGCVLAKGMFLMAAYSYLPYGTLSPALCYAIGAIGGDQQLCIAALFLANRLAAGDSPKDFDLDEVAQDKRGIHPEDFDSTTWSLVPENYQAVLRGTLDKVVLGQIGQNDLRDEFDETITEYCGEHRGSEQRR